MKLATISLNMNKLLILSVFLFVTPILIITGLSIGNNSVVGSVKGASTQIFAALPQDAGSISISVTSSDARVLLVKRFLDEIDAPLAAYSQELVTVADLQGVDYRLVAAIARQESNGCKFIPPESYNCWGWGIHERGTLHFDSYQQGIETVTAGLKKNYIDKGLTSPEEIMQKYAPKSPGTWSNAVSKFLSDME